MIQIYMYPVLCNSCQLKGDLKNRVHPKFDLTYKCNNSESISHLEPLKICPGVSRLTIVDR